MTFSIHVNLLCYNTHYKWNILVIRLYIMFERYYSFYLQWIGFSWKVFSLQPARKILLDSSCVFLWILYFVFFFLGVGLYFPDTVKRTLWLYSLFSQYNFLCYRLFQKWPERSNKIKNFLYTLIFNALNAIDRLIDKFFCCCLLLFCFSNNYVLLPVIYT